MLFVLRLALLEALLLPCEDLDWEAALLAWLLCDSHPSATGLLTLFLNMCEGWTFYLCLVCVLTGLTEGCLVLR